jgi:N-acetylglucosamine kinase-like BadF-type ATPase
VAPDGREARFPSLGPITGDWGGGYDVGLAAVSAAARSEDGRGPKSSLESSVPRHFGLSSPTELAEAIHGGRIAERRVLELAPLVFEQADADAVARAIMDRLAAEVVAMARVALTRLGLEQEPVEVVLGGGLLQNAADGLVETIATALAETAPRIAVRATGAPAIVGAALLGLDALDATPAAKERLRGELGAAAGLAAG